LLAYTKFTFKEFRVCVHISCESEGPLVMTAGHEFYKKLTCPKAEHVVRSVDGGEAHCKIEFDWLDGVFK
jgi:hypothetical protein